MHLVITLSSLFFIMAAYSTRSPFAEVGAARETLQVMSYEPMVIFTAVGMYMIAGTFDVAGLFDMRHPLICYGWPIFLGLLFILTIKLRKSPFDISSSHHAHQELVKGITTEMSGPLARVQILHWCENVLFRLDGMFFLSAGLCRSSSRSSSSPLVYFPGKSGSTNFARVKWRACFQGMRSSPQSPAASDIAVLAFA